MRKPEVARMVKQRMAIMICREPVNFRFPLSVLLEMVCSSFKLTVVLSILRVVVFCIFFLESWILFCKIIKKRELQFYVEFTVWIIITCFTLIYYFNKWRACTFVYSAFANTYWNSLDIHERDHMTFQNTCDIPVDIWDHTRGRGTGCDKNPQYTHQDMLQYMFINRFVNMKWTLLYLYIISIFTW